MKRLGIIKWLVLSMVLVAGDAVLPEAARCKPAHDVYMYRNQAVGRPTSQFSPTDRIVVRIRFRHLPKGSYTFQADWYNATGEFQDTSKSHFAIETNQGVVSESELELMRAGRLKRLFSTSETTGYHIKFYGTWKVKLFLNGEEVVTQQFEIR